jgi:S-adenosylmethionine:tRNA ribosyltransferase-isomerase
LVLEARGEGGTWIVRAEQHDLTDESIDALLERYGQLPLPPYIRQGREAPGDRLAYQTIYAQHSGSAAAPTAGLHFTDRVFAQLTERAISWVDLTLHIGVGTFRPIAADCIENHVMHAEWAELSAMSAAVLEARRRAGGRIVAVGTTAARTLETAATGETFQPFAGDTRLYIQPGHTIRGFDALITNFHLPRSSLLVLVSAFAGLELTRAAYRDAVLRRYRFYSFGDAMLIL